MGILTHTVTYQGYDCVGVGYRRSIGLNPEHGWVDIDLSVLGSIKMIARNIPWRSANLGLNIPAQFTIEAWKQRQSKSTVTSVKPIEGPKGGGLNRFGDLVLTSYEDGTKKDQFTYTDVYVHDSGVEEITRGLKEAKSHSQGIVRVPLSDIRMFYRGFGAFCHRINCKLSTGEWEKGTVQKNRSPWSAEDVVRFLFSQLPGCPLVSFKSDASAAPPTGLIGEGEAVLSFLQKVLEELGLVAQLQPENNYIVSSRLSNKLGYGKYWMSPGKSVEGDNQHDETKSVWVSDRPPMIQVFGKRRIRRQTLPYVPIFKDLDGRYYRLQDIGTLWGYSLNQVNAQVSLAPQKSFEDLPATSPPILHWKRRKILQDWAYRGYAPACYFDMAFAQAASAGAAIATGGMAGGGVAPSFTDEDIQKLFWLPMREVPYYIQDLKNLGIKYDVNLEAKKGDAGKFILLPPLVYGRTTGQDFFADWSAVNSYFDAIISDTGNVQNFWGNYVDSLGQQLSYMEEVEIQADKKMKKSFDLAKASEMFKAGPNVVGQLIPLLWLADYDFAKEITPGALSAENDQTLMARVNEIPDKVKLLKTSLESATKSLASQQAWVGTWRNMFAKYQAIFKSRKGIFAWMNLPYGLCSGGTYSIDEHTGIVCFGKPYYVAQNPFWLDGDPVTAIGDGNVAVTFGYEVNTNSSGDFTSFLFSVEGDPPPKINLCGVNRCSPIAARPERAPNMRMYEADLGTPFNLAQCYTEALGLVQGILQTPRVVEGYTYVYDGLLKAVLDSGVTSIQHEWDVKSAGRTHIMVNAPNSRGPLGPARLSGGYTQSDVPAVAVRQMLEAMRDIP